jgi:hypothetical protein
MPPKRLAENHSDKSVPNGKRRKLRERVRWSEYAACFRYILDHRALARCGTIYSDYILSKISQASAAAEIAEARDKLAAYHSRWPSNQDRLREVELLANALEADQEEWAKFRATADTSRYAEPEPPTDLLETEHPSASDAFDPLMPQRLPRDGPASTFVTYGLLGYPMTEAHTTQFFIQSDVTQVNFFNRDVSGVTPWDGTDPNMMPVGDDDPDWDTFAFETGFPQDQPSHAGGSTPQ